MKKAFMIVMIVAVTATVLGVNVGSAGAASSSAVLYLPGVTQGQLNDASVFVNSEYHDIECTLKDAETGKVVCHVPGKYAGKDVTLYVAWQMFFAVVSAPNTPADDQETHTCPEGGVLLYSYTAYYYGDFDWSSTVPVWLWQQWEANGNFATWESMGYTFEITETFCAPDW